MPFIDVRNLPQITSIQDALNAILDRANVKLGNWQNQLAQKVAEFYATPNTIDAFNTRLAFVKAKATARGKLDAFSTINAAHAQVQALGAEYAAAKPVVASALAQVDAASGASVPSSVLSAVAKAGVRMAGVFSTTKTQDSAISALERGILTPAEAADLYKQLQNPKATRNTLMAVGAVVMVWLLLRRR